MRIRLISVVALVSVIGLTACGTFQYREARGTYCRDETTCPYEVN